MNEHEDRVLGPTPRDLPRALVWRLLFGNLIAFGCLVGAFGMVLLFAPASREEVRIFEAEVLFPLGLVGVGLALLISRLCVVLPQLSLLRYGTETTGKVIRTRSIEHVEGIAWKEIVLEYDVDGRTYSTTALTLRVGPIGSELILYDPHAPARATTLDHIIGPKVQGGPRISFDDLGYSIAPEKAQLAGGKLQARPGIGFNLLVVPPALFAALLAALVCRLI